MMAKLRRPPAVSVQDGLEQAGEACVEVVAAERLEAFSALNTGLHDAGLAKYSEVMRERGLGEAELETAAGPFLGSDGKPAHDLEPGRVAERVKHGRKFELLAGWVMRLSHGGSA
jgi:hypothetical protein